jgi:hypothetical protein
MAEVTSWASAWEYRRCVCVHVRAIVYVSMYVYVHTQICMVRLLNFASSCKYKVVQIWPGQTVTCLHTQSVPVIFEPPCSLHGVEWNYIYARLIGKDMDQSARGCLKALAINLSLWTEFSSDTRQLFHVSRIENGAEMSVYEREVLSLSLSLSLYIYIYIYSRALPLQAWTGQWGSGRLRPRIFLTFGTRRSSALRTGRLYSQEFPWCSYLEAESTPGHMVPSLATERIPSDSTGDRSRDLPTSSAVP